MLPENMLIRHVTQVRINEEGEEISREIVDVAAAYAWKLTHLRTGDVTWVSEDDVSSDTVTRRLFHGRREGEPATHLLEKVGKDGETRYGPIEI